MVLHVTSCSSKFFQAFTYKQNSICAHIHTQRAHLSLSCVLGRRKQLCCSWGLEDLVTNLNSSGVWGLCRNLFLQHLVSVSAAGGANAEKNFANGHPYLRGKNVFFCLPHIFNLSLAGTPVQEQAAPSVKPWVHNSIWPYLWCSQFWVFRVPLLLILVFTVSPCFSWFHQSLLCLSIHICWDHVTPVHWAWVWPFSSAWEINPTSALKRRPHREVWYQNNFWSLSLKHHFANYVLVIHF